MLERLVLFFKEEMITGPTKLWYFEVIQSARQIETITIYSVWQCSKIEVTSILNGFSLLEDLECECNFRLAVVSELFAFLVRKRFSGFTGVCYYFGTVWQRAR